MLENMTCVYKSNVDLYFYVMGSNHENEVKGALLLSEQKEFLVECTNFCCLVDPG